MTANYIIEFKQIGKLIKVSAIDPATLTEISIAVPAGKNISQQEMGKLAVKRLEFVLRKKNNPG
jgi:hypothetical protein